jgi:hypothetical protein
VRFESMSAVLRTWLENCSVFIRHPAVGAIVLLTVSLTVYMNGRYAPVADSIPQELLPITLLREHNFDFDEFVAEFATADGRLPYFFVEKNKHVLSFYGIVAGLLNVPAYLIADALGLDLLANRARLTKWTTSVLTALSVAFMYLVNVRICAQRRNALLISLLYAFATCCWSVAANTLWWNGPSLLFLSIALILLLQPDSRLAPLCGFFLGIAVCNRPTNLAFALPLAAYMLLYNANWKLFVASAAVPAILMGWYSYVYWGDVWSLGQGHRPVVDEFSGSILNGVAGLLFSPARGLFIYSPIFLFSLPVLAVALFGCALPPLYRYLSVGLLLDLLITAKWRVWWGGWSFGYRMLIELLPGLTVLLALAWERTIATRWRLQVAFWPTVLVSFYIHFLGAFYYPSDWNYSPRSVDRDRARLWDVRDTELRRLQARFGSDLRSRWSWQHEDK